jgi:succinate dehydrogenase/fumarate reductase flavoprotein subunit
MITEVPAKWDRDADVIVVGSGGAAMTAATLAHDGGAAVLLIEKAAVFGGTTGVSGGVMWIPQNDHMQGAGFTDDREDALTYIQHLAKGQPTDDEQIAAWVDAAPAALRYLEAHTPVEMQTVPDFPDYYYPFDVPGRRAGGRSVEPVPYDAPAALGAWKDRLSSRIADPNLGGVTTLAEDMSGKAATLGDEIARREARDIRCKGAALIGRLFRGLLDRGVDVEASTPAHELVVTNGEVVGVRATHKGRDVFLRARRGVILACGGFEWNQELVRAFIGYDIQPLSPPHNRGDGLLMAMAVGASLGNMNSYWGQPAMLDPGVMRDGRPVPQFESGRGEPGTLIVNGQGERFANESLPYNDFPKAFGRFDPSSVSFPNQAPAWQVFDQRVKDRITIVGIGPGDPPPPWMPTGTTFRELARQLGVDPERFEATMSRFNDHAARGEDPDFGRTEAGLMAPGRVRALDSPPYYAVEIHPGALGTNGGPRIDTHGRVRAASGGVIPGLYAAGNTAANTFGWAYPSGGGTIGNAVVFGYLAGRHAATRNAMPSPDAD